MPGSTRSAAAAAAAARALSSLVTEQSIPRRPARSPQEQADRLRWPLGLRRVRAAGIPAGGLFTGAEDIKQPDEVAIWGGTAGVAYDPCYHAACDTFANMNLEALDEMSDAVAHSVLTFAKTTSAVEGMDKGNGTPGYDPAFKGHRAVR